MDGSHVVYIYGTNESRAEHQRITNSFLSVDLALCSVLQQAHTPASISGSLLAVDHHHHH
jgi:hypothetical protein